MSENLSKKYNFVDLFLAGYIYIIGLGIITILPIIISNSKGASWLSFLLGGIISLLTGLSYARLNLEIPTNSAEYAWILNSFTTKKDREEKNSKYKTINGFAIFIIYMLFIFSLLSLSLMSISCVKMMTDNGNVINEDSVMNNKYILNTIIILSSAFINILLSQHTKNINIGISIITTIGIIGIIFIALFKNFDNISKFDQNKLFPESIIGLLIGTFFTIYTYNGFQGLVLMSEEAKNETDIPLAMICSIALTMFVYILITLSVIKIYGVNKSENKLAPLIDAFVDASGDAHKKKIYIMTILIAISSIVLFFNSKSRLLKKIAELDLVPKDIKHLLQEVKHDSPIYCLIIIMILVLIITFIFIYIEKKGTNNSIKFISGIANIFIFCVFLCINIAVVYNHEKGEDETEKKHKGFNKFLKNTYPFYGIIGAILSIVLIIASVFKLLLK